MSSSLLSKIYHQVSVKYQVSRKISNQEEYQISRRHQSQVSSIKENIKSRRISSIKRTPPPSHPIYEKNGKKDMSQYQVSGSRRYLIVIPSHSHMYILHKITLRLSIILPPPPKFLNAPLPITSQVYSTPPCTPPSPPIEVPLSDQLFEMTSVTYYKTLYTDGAPKNNICIKATKIQQSFRQLFNALLL
jgi:hypothetical protein